MSSRSLELPLGRRTAWYRIWETVPALLSYTMLLLIVVLSFISSFLASIYLLAMIFVLLVRAVGIAIASIKGRQMMVIANKIDWSQRLKDLGDPEQALLSYQGMKVDTSMAVHISRLQEISAHSSNYPVPNDIWHVIIIAAYNEGYDVIAPTIESLVKTDYDHSKMLIVFAYEERGGLEIKETALRLKKKFSNSFGGFYLVEHPDGLPHEVKGKGSNITYAAKHIVSEFDRSEVNFDYTLVTTLDCDNKPHPHYFNSVSYEFIVHRDRQSKSFQPLALYFGNIWDAPAPMRVIALGNTFWTITSSVRPYILRNFAAHSQPLSALMRMGYWSTRSIVEDGHQYWRSYFFFKGNYEVIPIYLPVYQDAVLAGGFKNTSLAQFKQLRRWSYGASDIPYVAVRLFGRRREVPFFGTLARFLRLIDSHISLATIAILVTIGGWIPLLINHEAFRDIVAHSLPDMVSVIQRVAMVGIFITIILSLRILPPRPAHIKKRRTLSMILQWVLIPVTSICYSSAASLNAQTHLLLGKYLDTFDVTEKSASK